MAGYFTVISTVILFIQSMEIPDLLLLIDEAFFQSANLIESLRFRSSTGWPGVILASMGLYFPSAEVCSSSPILALFSFFFPALQSSLQCRFSVNLAMDSLALVEDWSKALQYSFPDLGGATTSAQYLLSSGSVFGSPILSDRLRVSATQRFQPAAHSRKHHVCSFLSDRLRVSARYIFSVFVGDRKLLVAGIQPAVRLKPLKLRQVRRWWIQLRQPIYGQLMIRFLIPVTAN